MKKMILALLAVGTMVSAQAQRAGTILVYGNAGIQTNKNTDDDGLPGTTDVEAKTMEWQFQPGIGYNFNNNWAAGLNIGLTGGKTTYDPTAGGVDEVKDFNLAVGPFVRYTHDFNNTFFVYKQLDVSYIKGNTNFVAPSPIPEIKNSYSGFMILLTPAVGVNLNSTWGLTFNVGGLGYQSVSTDFEGPSESTNNSFIFDFGRGFSFGLQANFGHRARRGYTEPGTEHRMINTDDDDEETPRRRRSRDDQ